MVGHLFLWADEEPHTTDPRYAGRLERGPHNVVTCDGVRVREVTRCLTGTGGWVESYRVGADGMVCTENGHPVKDWTCGHVVFADVRDGSGGPA